MTVLRALVKDTVERFEAGEADARYSAHRTLNELYEMVLCSRATHPVFNQGDPVLMEIQRDLEAAWERFEDSRVPTFQAPEEPQAFGRWFKNLVLTHEVADHPLYRFLEEAATREQMAHFFRQECTVDARFDDLVALSQVGTPDNVKMELATNYWDEMGNGHMADMHTRLFGSLLAELGVTGLRSPATLCEEASWEALACGNLLINMALYRKHAYKALGALGTTEMQSPKRFSRLVRGFKRLGLSQAALQYHTLHISIDTRHGNGWLRHAIVPTVATNPQIRHEIVQGAFYRLHVSRDYCQQLYELYTSGFAG
jgi:hypothetical protein